MAPSFCSPPSSIDSLPDGYTDGLAFLHDLDNIDGFDAPDFDYAYIAPGLGSPSGRTVTFAPYRTPDPQSPRGLDRIHLILRDDELVADND